MIIQILVIKIKEQEQDLQQNMKFMRIFSLDPMLEFNMTNLKQQAQHQVC
jgi:hypothetical protein